MDDSLLAKIDDVVHTYDKRPKKDNEGRTGHLVLFNIEDRPKYCYIPNDKGFGNEYSLEGVSIRSNTNSNTF